MMTRQLSNFIGAVFLASILFIAGATIAGSIPDQTGNVKGLTISSVKVEKMAIEVQTLSETAQRHDLTADKSRSEGMALSPTLQGGEDIATAAVIPSLPFLDSGTTAGYLDDYQEDCDGEGLINFPDVVYSYTPQRNETVNISTCESSYFTRLFVYRTSADTLVACNRFAVECGQPPRSGLFEVLMDSGMTYYIVIDGDDLQGSLPPGYGEYVLDCTREPILADSAQMHPSFADNGFGDLMLAYEDIIILDDGSADSLIMWLGSNDDATSFAAAGAWSLSASHPSIKYWGSGTRFYGTLVPGSGEADGGQTYLIDIDNTGVTDFWGLFSWDWTQWGWHDMKMSAIATDDQLETWQWGMISFVSSTTYEEGLTDAPHISYPIGESSATISWLVNVDGCATTDIVIDKTTRRSYAVYDWLNPETNTWELLIRQDFVDSLLEENGPGTNAWVFAAGDTLEHAQYPAVASAGGNLVILTEYWDENTGDDRDIICWYSSDSDLVEISVSVVAATTDLERFPKIAHISDAIFLCTFVRGDTLFQSLSYDGGATWGTPEMASAPEVESIVAEYRGADMTEKATRMAWEWRIKDDPDSSIFIRIVDAAFVLDSDGDGVPDESDLCPGYDDNIDENQNGIPDGCDFICGDANGDRSVNVGDAVYVINYIFRFGPEPMPLQSADTNCDGSVNIGDGVYLLNYVFRFGDIPCFLCQ